MEMRQIIMEGKMKKKKRLDFRITMILTKTNWKWTFFMRNKLELGRRKCKKKNK